MDLDAKRARALRAMDEAVGPSGRLGVAFSGGVDSAYLLALACEGLGPERVVAITARSESLASSELELARRLARRLGVRHLELVTREMEREAYQANAGDRCYHCKSELFQRIDPELCAREGIVRVAYGANQDDLGDHRPGMRAAREHEVLAPLALAELSKPEIRQLSRELGLETWDKPAQPCLASRIPYGQRVRPDKLSAVERAEEVLRGLGLRELRVRHHEQPAPGGRPQALARIEVPLADLPRLLEPGVRERVVEALRAIGFAYVVLDLEGFRSGRLNEALGDRPGARRLPAVQGI